MIGWFKRFFEKYERRLSSAALVGGFILDNLTFQRIDRLLDSLILLGYIFIAAIAIYLLSLGKLPRFLPLVLQFTFGGLASAFFIFYSRSGSFASSWPFLLLLAGLLIGNEVFKKRYEKFAFRLSVFYFVLFSYCISYLPVVTGKIGPTILVLSGLASLVLIWFFIKFLKAQVPEVWQESGRSALGSVAGIFLLVNVLYFLNVIPPIPLALKDSDILHSISRNSEGQYEVLVESEPWYAFLQGSQKVHIMPGDTLYAYSAVFAPTRLSLDIIHEWQHDSEGGWQTVSTQRFPIVGGRDGGYRGYSLSRNVSPGRWRVNVKTATGQIIGRLDFIAISGPAVLEKEAR